MSKIDELKAEIERLASEEFAELFRWLSEKDWEQWDKEIEADSRAGKLDFLVREAAKRRPRGLSRTCGQVRVLRPPSLLVPMHEL